MTEPDGKIAEQLWLRAHEAIKRGNLPQAVRDLAKSFEILKAVGDPRVRQVHAKWVAVHKMYLEEKQGGGGAAAASTVDYKTLQAEAESAANAGDLTRAIGLYEQVVAGQPTNELAKERIGELKQAQARAAELSGPQRAAPGPGAAQPGPDAAAAAAAREQAAREAAAREQAAREQAAREQAAREAAEREAAAREAAAREQAAQEQAAAEAAAREQAAREAAEREAAAREAAAREQAAREQAAFASASQDETAGFSSAGGFQSGLEASPEAQVAFLEGLLAQVKARRRSPGR